MTNMLNTLQSLRFTNILFFPPGYYCLINLFERKQKICRSNHLLEEKLPPLLAQRRSSTSNDQFNRQHLTRRFSLWIFQRIEQQLYAASPGLEEQLAHSGQVQNVGDVFTSIANLKGFAVVTFTLADVTIDIHVGEEVHLDPFGALSLARFTPSVFNVEAESAGAVAANLGLACLGIKLADLIEHSGIGGGV